jgi:hypothetical protein
VVNCTPEPRELPRHNGGRYRIDNAEPLPSLPRHPYLPYHYKHPTPTITHYTKLPTMPSNSEEQAQAPSPITNVNLHNSIAMGSDRSILACPAELIDNIITHLCLKDIQHFRAACRVLQAQSRDHFQKTFFTRKAVDLSPDGVNNLLTIADNEGFGDQVRTLVIRFHDQAMQAACSRAYGRASDPFTRWAFVDEKEYPAIQPFLRFKLFEKAYFQNAIRSHSPGDLIWSTKEYRHGDVITCDMANSINTWIAFIRSEKWAKPLEEAIAKLPNLKAVTLWDDGRDMPALETLFSQHEPGFYRHPSEVVSIVLRGREDPFGDSGLGIWRLNSIDFRSGLGLSYRLTA